MARVPLSSMPRQCLPVFSGQSCSAPAAFLWNPPLYPPTSPYAPLHSTSIFSMPCIERNPGLEVCPNFASPHYDPLRTLITNTGATEQEAIAQLAEAWSQENQARKEAWEWQVEEDQQAVNEEDCLTRELEQEELDTAYHEREKKKPKIHWWHHLTLSTIHASTIMTLTLIACQTYLAFHGKISKTIPFSHEVPYLGFMWDIQTRTVAIPSEKKRKYIDAIEDWASRMTHVLDDVQKLYGKLLHASLVVPRGRAYLTSLEAMLGSFNNRPFIPHHAPCDTVNDLLWWKETLLSPVLSHPIPGPSILIDLQAYSDASSGVGIAITISDKWWAWRLLPGWKSDNHDIIWAEAVRFKLLVWMLLVSETPGTHLKLYGNNWGLVEGWWKGRSKNRPTNTIFCRVHSLSLSSGCTIHTLYVPSKDNPADKPSRGIYPPTPLLLPKLPIPDELTSLITDFDTNLSHAELYAHQCGLMASPYPKPAKDYSDPPKRWALVNEPQLWYEEQPCETEDKQ